MPTKLRLLSLCFTLCFALVAMGQDSLRISWLTCGPGQESYSLYGHTALRVQNLEMGEDVVYNYGMFDFNAPHFAWRFALGQTDYFLGIQRFGDFVTNYAYHNRWVDEQELLLRQDEKQKLVAELYRLASLEDWTYRYNFLKDNCTTRALQSVEEALNGNIFFPPSKQRVQPTYRHILHEYAQASPWGYVGNDLLLGAEVDQPISVRQQCFSPIYAEHFLSLLKVKRTDGSLTPLATKPVRLVVATVQPTPNTRTPLFILLGILTLIVSLSVWEAKHRQWWRAIDSCLFLVQGVAGCIVAFLFFFSEHPAVGSNWHLLWLNPLSLLLLPALFYKRWVGAIQWYYIYYTIAFLALCGISLLGLQEIIIEIVVLASLLLVRAWTYLYTKVRFRHLR